MKVVILAILAFSMVNAVADRFSVGNQEPWRTAPLVSSDWAVSEEAIYTAASFKGGLVFGNTWQTCASSASISWESLVSDDSSATTDIAFQASLNNCQWGDLKLKAWDWVPFSLVQCHKDLTKAYASLSVAQTVWMGCLKSSLTAIGYDVTSDFFFDEKLQVSKKFEAISEYVESQWTVNTIGGYSKCVETTCAALPFADKQFTNADYKDIFNTAWGQKYHKDAKTLMDTSCTGIKVADTVTDPGATYDATKLNTCFDALIPILVAQDREKVQCLKSCVALPTIFKGPFGPTPTVSSNVDGELWTSSQDGENIREKAVILNGLVTCAAGVANFDGASPFKAPTHKQTGHLTSSSYNSIDLNGSTDKAWLELQSQEDLNKETRTCLWQHANCRNLANWLHEGYKQAYHFPAYYSSCISSCVSGEAGNTGNTLNIFTVNGDQPKGVTTVKDSELRWNKIKAGYEKCEADAKFKWGNWIKKYNTANSATLISVGAAIMGLIALII